ncbi:hypothetical protein GOB17_27035 [Sinorhizobium meliloti]|uniref:hypothetical protein n=1 Tax=Rhizobium meliloti TaxID=382 RepID=UPI000FD81A2B|nr:hypothetical protein [Sinorhizobium meliloti]MDW9583250.1 hypothetical protein [Sinorhizobium meliloti]MDX2329288.1 hypothetical protein [Sinorhizobium medicae]RVL29967.1 hypothetical protein CN144_15160 [Sinorhizobium meliloti]
MPGPAEQAATDQAAQVTQAADETKEIMFKWVDVVLGQSGDLWTLTLSILTATVLVGLHLYNREEPSSGASALEPIPRWLNILLGLSFACCLLSLILAYMLKGAVIVTLQDGLDDGKFDITSYPALNALGQAILLFVGASAFVCAAGLRPRLVLKSLYNVLLGRG